MNPIEASILTAELLTIMDRLSTLDLHPLDNGADIDMLRAEALDITGRINAYLVTSDNFIPVIEADDAVQEWAL